MTEEQSKQRAAFRQRLKGSALDQAIRANAAANDALGIYPKGVVQHGIRNSPRPCVGYVRISRDDDMSQSVENQISKVEEWIKKTGHRKVRIYADRNVSGRRAPQRRPAGKEAFDRLKELSTSGERPIFVVTRLDRFSRSSFNTLHAFRMFERWGVDVAYTEYNMDTSTPEGKTLMMGQMMVFEMEAEEASRRRKGANEEPRKVGAWLNNATPIGFKVNRDRFLIEDHENWDVVRVIEQLLDELPPHPNGYPWAEIAERVNELGFRTPYGKKWVRQSLSRGWKAHKRQRRRIDELRRQGHPVYADTTPPS